MDQPRKFPSLKRIMSAARRIGPYVHKTPVLTCRNLDHMTSAKLFFKCENFQKSGAFKIRGATNSILKIPKKQIGGGVCCHSSGNYGASMALSATQLGIKSYIVMPKNCSPFKSDLVKEYGGNLVLSDITEKSRVDTMKQVAKQKNLVILDGSSNPNVIPGMGTCSLEFIKQVNEHFDYILTPISGGGICSSTILTSKYISPRTKVIGVEPELAKDAYLSLKTGVLQQQLPPKTKCDGLRIGLAPMNWEIIRRHIHDILCVEDNEVMEAMKLIWERVKILVEPSSATVLAAVLKHPTKFHGKNVGLILTGGNVVVKNTYQDYFNLIRE